MDTASHEMLNLLKTRRSVRAYKADPVPEELLDQVLEAGTYAPSAMGRQSPTLIAVTSPKYREQISKLNAAVMGTDKDPYYGAPVIVLALADPAIGPWVEDASCALENMMLAAHALGLSTVWVHREREIFDSEAGKALLLSLKSLAAAVRTVCAAEEHLPVLMDGPGAAPAPQPKPRKEGYTLKV